MLDTGELSPRVLLTLVIHLDKDGAFYASRRGGQHYRGWGTQMYALAELVDAQKASNHLFLLANRDPAKAKPKLPKPFPRPEDLEPKTVAYKPGSFAAMIVAAKKAQRLRREKLDG